MLETALICLAAVLLGIVLTFAGAPIIQKLIGSDVLPFLKDNKTYRCFQIKGDSMLPVPENSWVTCSYVNEWEKIRDGNAYVVVTKSEGIVFKLVYKKLYKSELQLVSTNRNYAPYNVHVSQVVELWQFETLNSFSIGE